MDEEETGSSLTDSISGAGSELWDAGSHLLSAAKDAAVGTGQTVEAMGEHIAATGVYLATGEDSSTFESLQAAANTDREAAHQSFSAAGSELGQAWDGSSAATTPEEYSPEE
jgi:hypothetical protein